MRMRHGTHWKELIIICVLIVGVASCIMFMKSRESFTVQMPTEIESTWNTAWGVGRCEAMAKYQDKLSDTAAVTRLDFIQNMRIKRDNSQENTCYMRMEDPVIQNKCSVNDNKFLKQAFDQGIITSAKTVHTAQPDLIVPKTRCAFSVAEEYDVDAIENVWSSWGKADCKLFSKASREKTEQGRNAYDKLVTTHLATLSDIEHNRNQLTTLKPALEACIAEDSWFNNVNPVEKNKRDTCLRDYNQVASDYSKFKSYCETTTSSLASQQKQHTVDLEAIKKRLEAATAIYNKASQDLNGKVSLVQATEKIIIDARTTAEELEASLVREWRPKHAMHVNTVAVKRKHLTLCDTERAELQRQVDDLNAQSTQCNNRSAACARTLKSTKDTNAKLGWELSELADLERRLRLELAKLQAQVELCNSNYNQCNTDRARHQAELDELKRRLTACLAALGNDRNTHDATEMSRLNAMRNEISTQLTEQGRKCDDPTPSPQSRIVQATNSPVGTNQVPSGTAPSQSAPAFREPIDSEGKLVN